MSGWRGIRRRRSGSFGHKLKAWFRKKYRKEGKQKFSFTIGNLMNEVGLDYDNRLDYSRTYNFIQEERNAFKQVLTSFLQSEEYLEKKDEGLGEKEVFDLLVDAVLSRDIYPVWCEQSNDYTYYFFNFNNFVEFTKARMKSIKGQIEKQGEFMSNMESIIPKIGEHVAPLRIEGKGRRLLTGDTKERCPFPDCDKSYRGVDSAALLNDHIRREHAPKREEVSEPPIDSFSCPTCGAPARDRLYKEMRGGDFKCRACKNIQPEEEIRGSGS